MKAAHLNKGMALMHLNRVDEAWAATDSAINMIPDLKPVAAAVKAAAASSPFAPLPANGKMHRLWPTAVEQAAYTPAELPFHLVSDDTETLFYTPVWISRAAGPDMELMNTQLAEVVRAVRQNDPLGNRRCCSVVVSVVFIRVWIELIRARLLSDTQVTQPDT